jgi:potassium-transporting ATPase KdpC subunit
MLTHLRANLLLLVLTIGICCVAYPAILLVIGQTAFHNKAEGSLLFDKADKPIGSRLIAQPFTGDMYFQPRPSAVSYNAAASGASNWGANNPNLRKRVVGMLGPILKYRDGRSVGPDIVTWVRDSLSKDRTMISKWAEADGYLAERWGAANAEALTAWEKEHSADTAKWHQDNPDKEITPTDLANSFFESFAKESTTTWLESDGADLQVAFFELWMQAHPQADLEPVPADMVMASGSGLDPHITLKAALYQLDRVAANRATTANRDPAELKKEIEDLLRANAAAPFGGLVGVDLINVLEVNLALKDRYGA